MYTIRSYMYRYTLDLHKKICTTLTFSYSVHIYIYICSFSLSLSFARFSLSLFRSLALSLSLALVPYMFVFSLLRANFDATKRGDGGINVSADSISGSLSLRVLLKLKR